MGLAGGAAASARVADASYEPPTNGDGRGRRGLRSGALRMDLCIGAIALVCSVAISVAVVLLAFDRARAALFDNVQRLVSGAAQEGSSLLRASIVEGGRIVSLTAHMLERDLATAGSATRADRATVDYIKGLMPFASWVGLAYANGTVLAASDGILEGRDVSARPWFQQVSSTGALFLGDVHTAVLLQAFLAPNASEPLRFVDVAAPVKVGGNLAMVLGSHLHWDWARDLQQRTMDPVYAEANAELFIYSSDNTILLSPNKARWKESTVASAPAACAKTARARGLSTPVTSEEDWPAPSVPGRFITACSFLRQGGIEWVVAVRAPTPTVSQGQVVYASAGAVASVVLGIFLWALVWAFMRPFHAAALNARRLESAVASLAGFQAKGLPDLSGSGSMFREVWNLQRGIAGLEWTVQRAHALKTELHEADEEREELREQLRTLQHAKIKSQADLESPLAKAIAALASVQADARLKEMGRWAEKAIDQAVTHLLGRGSMLVPDLGRQVQDGTLELDRDTRHWLFTEVAPYQKVDTRSEPSLSPKTWAASGTGREVPSLRLDGDGDGDGGEPGKIEHPPTESVEAAARALVPAVCAWDGFDVFEASRAADGRPLLAVSLAALEALGLRGHAGLDVARFAAFVARVEGGYLANPYHNRSHAAEVTQAMAFLLTRGGLGELLSDADKLAALVAAVVHDFEHPGVNNNFLVAVADPLALRYNDRAPLESHHVSAAWGALLAPERNFLVGMPKAQAKELRRTVIDMVLATDMAQHFEVVGAFKKRAAAGALAPEGRLAPEDARLILSMAMKACDVGHAARPLTLHVDWSQRVADEFYAQGDRERAAGLPVSAFMDRATANLAKSQVGFMDFIVLPLLEALGGPFPAAAARLLAGAQANHRHWLDAVEAQAQAQAPGPEPAGGRGEFARAP